MQESSGVVELCNTYMRAVEWSQTSEERKPSKEIFDTSSPSDLRIKYYDCIGLAKGSFGEPHGLVFNYDLGMKILFALFRYLLFSVIFCSIQF